MLKIIPLGGLGEIGLNMMVIEYHNTLLIIDSGIMFPETHMLGINYAIPDMNYLYHRKKDIAAIILTHAHEDHIGAISFFLKEFKVPILGTSFTLTIVRHKLKQANLFLENMLYEIFPNKKVKISPFILEFIKVNHSIVGGIALAIDTPIGVIIHTGDFRIYNCESSKEYTDIDLFEKYSKKKILALLSDSTNIEKNDDVNPAKKIISELSNIINKSSGRIIITLFASNITRIQQIINIAQLNKRKIVFDGKSLEVTVNAARKLGYINIHNKTKVDIKDINFLPDKKVMMIITGSQGEPMSALTRIAAGLHKQIRIKNGDVVILTSKFIPGNEKAITKVIDNLYRLGADVIYEKISKIHTSGHAFKKELKFMIKLTNPKFFIPIHGEYRHLVLHCKLAHKMGISKDRAIIAQNGQIIELYKNYCKLSKQINAGKILINTKNIGNVNNNTLKDRHILSTNGVVAINIIINKKTGINLHDLKIKSKGFIFKNITGYLLDDAKNIVFEILKGIIPNGIDKTKIIESKIKSQLRQYFFYTTGQKPVIVPFILEI